MTSISNYTVDPDIASAILREFRTQSAQDSFCDFTVVVEGSKFKCHRFILAACSEFFNGLLRSGMRESLEQSVTIQGISKECFSQLLHCLYSGENVFTAENAIDMWHAINLLQINCLKQKCEDFVIDILRHNYVECYKHAKLLDCDRVLNVCLDLMCKEFEPFSKMESFVYIHPEDLLYLISHNHLAVPTEDLVIYAILKWVSFVPRHILYDYLEASEGKGCEKHAPHADNTERETDDSEMICDTNAEKEMATNIGFGENCVPELVYSGPSHTAANLTWQVGDMPSKVPTPGNVHSQVYSNETETEKVACTVDSVALSESQSKDIADQDYVCATQGHLFTSAERKSWLSRLLSASRLCLVSTICIEVLMTNPSVLGSQEALQMVRDAVVYQLKPSHALSHWPESAVHRASSKLENVTVFLNTKDSYLMAYSFEKDKTFYVSRTPCSQTSSSWFGQENLEPHSLSVFDNNIFLAKANTVKRGFSFPFVRDTGETYAVLDVLCTLTSPHNWAPVMSQVERVQVVLAHEKQLYLIGSSIYRITPGETLTLASASKVKALISIPCTPTTAYSFRNRILIFGTCQDTPGVAVLSFDPENLEVTNLSSFDGPADQLVAFNSEMEDFVLQRNGNLWRIDQDNDRSGTTKVQFITKLWGFDWNLRGALVYKSRLYLFGNDEAQPLEHGAPSSTGDWSSSVPGIFESTTVVSVPSATRCLPVVLPRKWLLTNAANMQHAMSI